MEELKNKIILRKYKIIKRIGKGSFGSVYLGKYVNKNDYVAIKFESKNQNDTILEREAYILYSLKGFGIPEVISYGQNLKYNILVQELLGKSIDKLFYEKKRKFSMKDCCMIGIQILDRLEFIHSKYIIHRDIKADNFLIGLKNNKTIYIIDFGLAKQYRSRKTGKHVKYTINKKWSGTSRFASANTLRGVEPSRRDDLESFCYLLLYLMKGSLPWDQINEESEINEILIIYKMKQYMTPEMLFRDLPSQMVKFYKYCKNLEFDQNPDYNYLRSLLLNILVYMGEQNDLHFSWVASINLNKCKSGFILNNKSKSKSKSKSKEKEKENKDMNISSNIKKNILKLKPIYMNNKNVKNIINLDYSTGKIDKKEKLDISIKNNILGHCNIIKRKYIKSQSPIIKRVVTDEDKTKKKIIPKKSVIIDLTNFIETKKANEIKSYRTKLFNYKTNEKQVKSNQSEHYGSYKNIYKVDQNEESTILKEKSYIKSPKNLFLKKIFKKNKINEASTYTSNNIYYNNTSYLKVNNLDKSNSKINGYYFKANSPNIVNKKFNSKINLNNFEESKNGYIFTKKKKLSSNSFGKDIKKQIKNQKGLKELDLSNNNKINNNINTNTNINKKLSKELTILIPRRQKTVYTFGNYKFLKLKNTINRSFINDMNNISGGKNNKNSYNLIYVNGKKHMAKSPKIVKRKKTDSGISTYNSFQKKSIFDSSNNIKKIMLNKNNIKKEEKANNNLNYIVKNNYIKEQIYSSYNKSQILQKKYKVNIKNKMFEEGMNKDINYNL